MAAIAAAGTRVGRVTLEQNSSPDDSGFDAIDTDEQIVDGLSQGLDIGRPHHD
jgi:hypothetical protein